ncbi:MAG TPA: AI-2E family transporter [Burkholderiales bacterium]|nr:AI-2E family transporter [Burkholderiales bacterium]
MVSERRIEQSVQIAAIVLLAVGCLVVLLPFLGAVLAAAILCFSTWPVYRYVEGKVGGRRWLAALFMTLLIIVVLVVPLTLIALSLRDDVPTLIENLRVVLEGGLPQPPLWVKTIPLFGEYLDAGWRELAGSREQLTEALKRFAGPLRQGLVATGLIIAEGVLQFVLIAFIAYFFYRDGLALVEGLRNALNRVAGDLTERLLSVIGGTITGVVYGIVGTGLAQGLAALIGFWIAGVPGAFMLASLVFILSIVPAGPPLIWLGATGWLVYHDQAGWAIFMALWGFFVVSGIDNVVKPLLISRGASLPFVLVLLGVLGGVLAWGFVGIFLGPTLLAVGFNLVRRWTERREGEPPAPQEGKA